MWKNKKENTKKKRKEVIRNKKARNRENGFSEKVFEFLKSKTLEALDLTATIMFDPMSMRNVSYSNPNYCKQLYYFNRSPYFEKKDNKFYVTPKGRIKIIKNARANQTTCSTNYS